MQSALEPPRSYCTHIPGTPDGLQRVSFLPRMYRLQILPRDAISMTAMFRSFHQTLHRNIPWHFSPHYLAKSSIRNLLVLQKLISWFSIAKQKTSPSQKKIRPGKGPPWTDFFYRFHLQINRCRFQTDINLVLAAIISMLSRPMPMQQATNLSFLTKLRCIKLKFSTLQHTAGVERHS